MLMSKIKNFIRMQVRAELETNNDKLLKAYPAPENMVEPLSLESFFRAQIRAELEANNDTLFKIYPPPEAKEPLNAEEIRGIFFNYRKDNNPILKWGKRQDGLSATGLEFNTPEEHRERSYRDLLAFNKQSIAFYIEVLPFFYQYILDIGLPLRKAYTFLDVGCRTGAGANLYGEVFCDERWGYGIKLIVDTTDINSEWREYHKSNFFINASYDKDVYAIPENSYDIVFCSHTIEHLESPVKFVKQLKKVAKYFAFVTCPFEESEPVISGHRRVTKEIVDECEPKMFVTYKSVNRWKSDLECCVFTV